MAVETDTLRTIMAVAGHNAYKAAMNESSAATGALGLHSGRTAISQNIMAVAQLACGAAAQVMALDEMEAAAASEALNASLNPILIVLGLVAGAALAVAGALLIGLGSAVAAVTVALKASHEEAAEFEAVMKEVELQSGASADAMRAIASASLSKDLSDIGVSAIQAGEGFKILASMGYSAADMQTAMLPITQTAVALGVDQAQTTQLMIALMKQYNLSIADMGTISDQLVGALNKTSMQGDQVAEVMRYAGIAAGGLGWSLAETAATVDPLIAAFGRAEMAGTYFRQMLNLLKDPTPEMAEAFKEAGLDVKDFGKNSHSAAQFLRWLQSGMWTNSRLAKAFGAEASAAAQVLLQSSVPAMEATTAAIYGTGQAAEYAKGKMSTYKGGVAVLTAEWSNLKVILGSAFGGLATNVVNALSKIVDMVKHFVEVWRDSLPKADGAMVASKEAALNMAVAIVNALGIVALEAFKFAQWMGKVAQPILFYAEVVIAYYRGLALMALKFSEAMARLFGLSNYNVIITGLQATTSAMLTLGETVHTAREELAAWAGTPMGGFTDKGQKTAHAIIEGWKAAINYIKKAKEEAKGGAGGDGRGPVGDMNDGLDDNEKKRKKMAKDMEDMAKKSKGMYEAIQMVIGGRLAEQVQEQIKRLSGGEFAGKGFLRGVMRQGDNRIILELRPSGKMPAEQVAQVAGWLVPIIREAGQRVPVGG
jgi:TP901 family phage tail tape measure protein